MACLARTEAGSRRLTGRCQHSKTNFYTPTKVALSFRLDPSFLPQVEYPQPLYGMFLVISSEFRGFHLVSRSRRSGPPRKPVSSDRSTPSASVTFPVAVSA